jgi:cytochrome c553
MMMLFTKVQINILSVIPSSLLLPFSLLPSQLQAGLSLNGDIKNGQSIAAEILHQDNVNPSQLVTADDSERSIPPYDICHGKDGKTAAEGTPVLAGQNADYLTSTMEYF